MDLDDILESALDDFEEEEEKQSQQQKEIIAENNNNLKSNDNNNNENNNAREGTPSSEQLAEDLSNLMNSFNMGGEGGTEAENLVNELTNLLNEPNGMDDMSDNILKMLQGPEWEKAAEGLTEQLLSKDILYEPMKAMRDKFPDWLEKNHNNYPAEEFSNFNKQFEFSTKICSIYESENQDFSNVLALMEEMQDAGQPPQDLLEDIVKDMNLNSDGNAEADAAKLFPGLFGNNQDQDQDQNPCPVQ